MGDTADWIGVSVKNIVANIKEYISLGMSKDDAVSQVRSESSAGCKVWQIVVSNL